MYFDIYQRYLDLNKTHTTKEAMRLTREEYSLSESEMIHLLNEAEGEDEQDIIYPI